MEAKQILEQCIKEEERYQFSSFSRADALKLGMLLYEESVKRGTPVAVEIRMNHLLVFCFYPEGHSENSASWLRSKAATVDMLHQSSLHLGAQMQVSGQSAERMRIPVPECCIYGGGFPLTIRGTGVIGSICVTGFPHMEDHQLIIDTLEKHMAEFEE